MAKILFFDDEDGPAFFLVKAMKYNKHDVDYIQKTSDINLDEIRTNRYDIIILDVRGEGNNIDEGIRFAEKLRKYGISIPIIFSTAFSDTADPEIFERAKKINNSNIIIRPHSNEFLIHMINSYLKV